MGLPTPIKSNSSPCPQEISRPSMISPIESVLKKEDVTGEVKAKFLRPYYVLDFFLSHHGSLHFIETVSGIRLQRFSNCAE